MNAINLPTRHGEPVEVPAAQGVTIQLTRTVDGGVSLYTHQGIHRVERLCRVFADDQLAVSTAQFLAEGLAAGIPVGHFWAEDDGLHVQPEDEPALHGALDAALAMHCADPRTARADQAIAALRRLKDDPHGAEELAAAIRADLEARDAQRQDARDRERADCAAIVAEGNGAQFWGSARRDLAANLQRTVDPPALASHAEVTALAALNCTIEAFAAREHINSRPHFHGAEAELSPAQCRALRVADADGRIWPAPGVTKATLVSLERKGYGTCTYGWGGGRPHEVSMLTLNEDGRNVAVELGWGEAA